MSTETRILFDKILSASTETATIQAPLAAIDIADVRGKNRTARAGQSHQVTTPLGHEMRFVR